MDVRHALFAVLATVSLTSCNTEPCTGGGEDFDLEETLTPEQVNELVEDYGADCEVACREAYARNTSWEPTSVDSCDLHVPSDPTQDGQVTCSGVGAVIECTEGRRPLGHVEASDDGHTSPLGRSLAAMAYLEAASVDAFEQLADALVSWGAPKELVERCHDAAADERHHARWFAALAAAHGGRVPTPTREHDVPTRLELAEHNAREGCVFETFAALIAGVRARRAPDLRLRRVFARVAADEARHAQLAWDLDEWFQGELDAGAVARVDAARDEALAQLPARARGVAQLPAAFGALDDAVRLAEEFGARLTG
ncbi:ferritin-like domain-containing protein [Enhygromyxa salina]|uniref:Lipoprotein n=1 Tax=Enhygromyxa salina TaxID=215803 RepID=A0A2S9YUX7_9BACT|nr:ferritin-like domain-containing protein [Enhygromyxa salina]PRQ08915.1 hypothetical protein ENSA7_13140 [Enhygromyxa salina]